jgi:hypothetical protein
MSINLRSPLPVCESCKKSVGIDNLIRNPDAMFVCKKCVYLDSEFYMILKFFKKPIRKISIFDKIDNFIIKSFIKLVGNISEIKKR